MLESKVILLNSEPTNEKIAESLVTFTLIDLIGFDNHTKRIVKTIINEKTLFKVQLMNLKFFHLSDTLEFFSHWMISLGEKKFFNYLKNPDILRKEFPNQNFLPTNENFAYVSEKAYNMKRNLILEGKDCFQNDEQRLLILMEEDFYAAQEFI